MKKTFCDCCEKQIEFDGNSDIVSIGGIGIKLYKRLSSNWQEVFQNQDLCRECHFLMALNALKNYYRARRDRSKETSTQIKR